MKRLLILKCVSIFAWAGTLSILAAQETATTRDGRSVILNADGTWYYSTNSSGNTAVSAIETVRKYLSASSWHERIPLVLNTEKVKPLMEARYSKIVWDTAPFEIVTSTEPIPSEAGWILIQTAIRGRRVDYYLQKTKKGYRIDWEASVGYNSISPEEFHATRPTNPVRFRTYAKLADYYNFEFRNARGLAWSISLKDSTGKKIGYGYAEKNSAMGQELFKILKDGTDHPIVIDVQYLPNARDAWIFLIREVVNTHGWWF